MFISDPNGGLRREKELMLQIHVVQVSGRVSPVVLLPCDRRAVFMIIRAPAGTEYDVNHT